LVGESTPSPRDPDQVKAASATVCNFVDTSKKPADDLRVVDLALGKVVSKARGGGAA
jgi:hypothetical protein